MLRRRPRTLIKHRLLGIVLIQAFFVFILPRDLEAKSSIFDLGELSFRTVGDKEKLPSCCLAIEQDKQGFIWIGSAKGLLRYDGYQFTLFEHDAENPDSLSGNRVISLWISDDNLIWTGTNADGVSVYNPQTDSFKRFQFEKGNEHSLSDNSALTIVGDIYGNVFVGTYNGLNHIDVTTGEVKRLPTIKGCETPFVEPYIQSLLLTQTNTLWIGTYSGLCRVQLPGKYDSNIRNWYSSITGETFTSLNNQFVTQLFETRDGKVWLATTQTGVAIIDTKASKSGGLVSVPLNNQQLSHAAISAIAQPNSEEIWLGTANNGIYIVDSANGEVKRHVKHDPFNKSSINHNIITTLLVDDSGLVWVGSSIGGLNQHNPKINSLRKLSRQIDNPNALTNGDVLSILELDNGQVWAGNIETGIDVIDNSVGVIGGFRPEPHSQITITEGYVQSMAYSFDGSVWVGTPTEGLHRYDAIEKKFFRYSVKDGLPDNYVMTLLATPGDQLWVGTYEGIALMDTAANKLIPLETFKNIELLSKKVVLSLAYAPDHLVWVGTTDGLFAMSLKNQSVTEILSSSGTKQTLSDNRINSLLIDKSGKLLVATGQGLDRLVSFDGEIAVFESLDRLVDRLPRYSANLMEDTKGRIWDVSGWLDPASKKWLDLDYLSEWNIGEKLLNSYTKTRDGTLLFGGTQGILMVRPELWQSWTYQPPLLISELEINNKGIPVPKQLTLAADATSVSLEFSALDYSAPNKNKYAYKLEGFDKDWIKTDSSKRRATYTNLPPGDYRFKVKGSNSSGTWSEHKINLAITQLPKWYETTWFKIALLLILLSAIYLFSQWRIKQLKLKKIALEKLVESRTHELQTKNEQLNNAMHKLEVASLTDQLTGAHNRHYFDKFIYKEIKQLQRDLEQSRSSAENALGLIIVDADHFKQVNDTYGHNAGDQVLIQFTQLLQQCCRDNDWTIRWGGEEFLIVCRSITIAEMQSLAERIRKTIEKHDFDIGDAIKLKKTCSLGMCTFPFVKNSFDAFTLEQTLHLADLALYLAKSSGRNAWVGVSYLLSQLDNNTKEQILDNITAAAKSGYIRIVSSIRGLNTK